MQRRAQVGLNKGEAHHASKNALRIGRQGETRDGTAEGQHRRMAGLNQLAAIIICWNTKHLGHAAAARKRAGLNCSPELLPPSGMDPCKATYQFADSPIHRGKVRSRVNFSVDLSSKAAWPRLTAYAERSAH